MSERVYTVKEIDALRTACTSRWLYGTTAPRVLATSRAYTEEERVTNVERLVRTYMAAGVTAEDLYAADKQ